MFLHDWNRSTCTAKVVHMDTSFTQAERHGVCRKLQAPWTTHLTRGVWSGDVRWLHRRPLDHLTYATVTLPPCPCFCRVEMGNSMHFLASRKWRNPATRCFSSKEAGSTWICPSRYFPSHIEVFFPHSHTNTQWSDVHKHRFLHMFLPCSPMCFSSSIHPDRWHYWRRGKFPQLVGSPCSSRHRPGHRGHRFGSSWRSDTVLDSEAVGAACAMQTCPIESDRKRTALIRMFVRLRAWCFHVFSVDELLAKSLVQTQIVGSWDGKAWNVPQLGSSKKVLLGPSESVVLRRHKLRRTRASPARRSNFRRRTEKTSFSVVQVGTIA